MKNSLSRGIIFGAIVGISLGVVVAGSAIAYFANQANQQTRLAQEQLTILQTQVANNNQTTKATTQAQSAIATSSLSASATDTAKILATTSALQAQVAQPTPIPKQPTPPPTSIPPSPTTFPTPIPTALPKTISANQKYEFEKYALYFRCKKYGSQKYETSFSIHYKGSDNISVKYRITELQAYASTNKKLKITEGDQSEKIKDLYPSMYDWDLNSIQAEFDTTDPDITQIYAYITIESKNIPSGTFGWSCPI